LNVALDSANDSVEVLQDTHDDLNLNANLQVGDADVSAGNPVPITLPGDKADLDSGAGTDDHEIIAIGLPGAGGHVVGGTATDPIRVDVTNDTEQTVNATDLDIRSLSHTGATPDSVQIGDGAQTVEVSGSNELSVYNSAATSSISIGDGTEIASVDINNRLEVKDPGLPAAIGPQTQANSTSFTIASDHGAIEVDATDLDIRSLNHSGATPDSVRIGDGVETANVNTSNELNVVTDGARSSTKITDGAQTLEISGSGEAHVYIDPATGSAVRLTDGIETASIDANNRLEVKDPGLPAATGSLTGANSTSVVLASDHADIDVSQATHDNLNLNANLQQGDADVTAGNAVYVQPGTGATFEAVQTTHDDLNLNANIQQGNADVTTGNALFVQAGTGATFESVQTTHDDLNANANIQVGNTDVGDANPVPIKIGTGESIPVTSGKMDVLDFIDNAQGPVLDASTTNIPSLAAGNAQIVVAALAANVKAVYVADTTGQFIGVYNKLTPASVDDGLEFIINPGMDRLIEVDLSGSAGTGIYLRNMVTGVINSGQLMMQFLG
jgi:hypothetical protein